MTVVLEKPAVAKKEEAKVVAKPVVLKKEGQKKKGLSPFNFTETTWISLEAFNLLDIDNTVSYLWIQDVGGTQFAVPNYLTSRQLNLKLHLSF